MFVSSRQNVFICFYRLISLMSVRYNARLYLVEIIMSLELNSQVCVDSKVIILTG